MIIADDILFFQRHINIDIEAHVDMVIGPSDRNIESKPSSS